MCNSKCYSFHASHVAPPPPATVQPSPVSEEDVINDNPQTVTIGVAVFPQDTVLITHYQIIAVFLPEGTSASDLDSNSEAQFPQNNLGAYDGLSCNSKPSAPFAYITAEMSGSLYKDLPGRRFVVGQDSDDDESSPNDRPNSYTNGPLCFSSSYTFFIRAFSASGARQVSSEVYVYIYPIFLMSRFILRVINFLSQNKIRLDADQ